MKKIINKVASFFKPAPKQPVTWFTSDFHFSHNNVRNYCDRPWASKDEMNEGLVKLWNEQVSKNDTVYVLGDFSLSPKAVIQFAPRLNGKKILICGNHDAPFGFNNPAKTKAPRMKEKYLNEFAEVDMERIFTLKSGQKILLAHMPYANDFTKKIDTRYLDQRPKDKGMVLLHGHLHCRYVKAGRLIDVGIDNNFKLYSEDDIIAIIKDPREMIPSRLTEWYKTRPQRTGMKGQADGPG